MSQKEKELREAITQAAEELADELVKWQEKKPKYTFSEMEKVAEALLETREASLPVPGPCCPKCGE